MSRQVQQPEKLWTFPDGTSGRLPKKRGDSNEFVDWESRPKHRSGGYWSNRKNKRETSFSWHRSHVELTSIEDHHWKIFKSKYTKHRLYKNMPFFDDWNPDKGGKLKNSEAWIIENLGKRPKNHSLHVVEHEKGFVPGNLVWANRQTQNSQQMFLIIARQKHEIIQLKLKIKELESR